MGPEQDCTFDYEDHDTTTNVYKTCGTSENYEDHRHVSDQNCSQLYFEQCAKTTNSSLDRAGLTVWCTLRTS